jgi:hypothetical protein
MKVWPASDELRKVLRHPVGGAFRDSGSGDWPDDTYTYRRLREGSILLVDPFASAPSPTPTIVAPTPVVSPDLTKEETEKLRQAWEKEQAPLEKFQEFVEPQKPVAPKKKAATSKEK